MAIFDIVCAILIANALWEGLKWGVNYLGLAPFLLCIFTLSMAAWGAILLIKGRDAAKAGYDRNYL